MVSFLSQVPHSKKAPLLHFFLHFFGILILSIEISIEDL